MNIQNVEKFTEKFEKDFQGYLTPDNTFYLNTKGITSSDLSVNIPQFVTQIAAGADSDAALTVNLWEEGNKVVTQKRFKTQAYQISDYKEFFTAQDQRQDCMGAMKNFMDTQIGNFAAYKFAPTTTTLVSSGTLTRATEVIGSTATVKVYTKADIIKAKTAMSKTNLPGKWYCLASPEAIADLLAIDDFVKADSLGVQQSRLLNGEFADILGIRFFMRAPSLGANVAYRPIGSPEQITKRDIYGVVGTADAIDNDTVGALIFWNESALYANKGMIKTYITSQDAIYQSDLMSMQYTYGVEPIRTDNVGVVALVEGV